MRFAAGLLVAFVCSGAVASDPGQVLDCSDVVFNEPGHTCVFAIPPDCTGSPFCSRGTDLAVSTTGDLFATRVRQIGNCGGTPNEINRFEILERSMDGGPETVVAYFDTRCNLSGPPDETLDDIEQPYGPFVSFDAQSGRLLVPIRRRCRLVGSGSGHCTYPEDQLMLAITGFPTTFDVLQTFTPPSTIGFRVPYMPEGFRAADSFDSYWGNLAHPLDFTQAHSLACNYPAAAPHVGDYLSVNDPLPNPEPGTGRYYVTAATYQGATRYGRQTMNHQTTGRNPALLPACTP